MELEDDSFIGSQGVEMPGMTASNGVSLKLVNDPIHGHIYINKKW
jgi:hypothetical protein